MDELTNARNDDNVFSIYSFMHPYTPDKSTRTFYSIIISIADNPSSTV